MLSVLRFAAPAADPSVRRLKCPVVGRLIVLALTSPPARGAAEFMSINGHILFVMSVFMFTVALDIVDIKGL